MTVRQLLANSDVEEVSEWMAYFDLEDPETAAWQRTSLLAANMTNMYNLQGLQKYPERVESDYFMPRKPKPVQTTGQQIDTLKALFPSE
tara:strand:- start:2358 stop:2624 length:267 start_codon:yes stop_codon:yes gene_type:complete